MRLLWVTHAWPRQPGDPAGHFLERLARALGARGHDLRVLTPADRGAGSDQVEQGIRVSRLRYAPRSWETLAHTGALARSASSPRGALALAGMGSRLTAATRLAARESDLVHAHWWVPSGVAAWSARLLGGRPYIVTLHGTDVRILQQSALARHLARRVLRGARRVTAVSAYLAAQAAELAGLAPDTIAVHPMPVAMPPYQPAARTGHGLVTVGRLSRQKRIHLLLETVAQLARDGTAMPLTIIGDGPERGALEALAGSLGVREQVRFLGQRPPEEISDLISAAALFLFAAEQEGLGLVAAEALMAGVPVVAVRSGGVADIVPETGGGRLVTEGGGSGSLPERMAHAVREVLSDQAAPAAAALEGERWRQRLSADSVARWFEPIYRLALRERSA
jgi:glycosyltransferase involved in cell wall biosynthesis